MRTIVFLSVVLFLCHFQLTVRSQALPLVVNNTNTGTQALNINFPLTGGVLDQLAVNSKLVASDIATGPVATSGVDGTSTDQWYQVDIPSPTGSEHGFVAAGSTFTNPDCQTSYVSVSTSSINIRTGPGVGYAQVYKGAPTSYAKVWQLQKFAVIQSQPFGADTWYEIYLTNGCSQTTGWIAGYYQGQSWVDYVPSPSSNGLPQPTLSYSNVTATSVTLTWAMSIQPSGTNATTFYIGRQLNGTGGWIQLQPTTSNTLTDNTLVSGNIYAYRVYAQYPSGCSSTLSNVVSFTTTNNWIYIPDLNFRAWLQANYPTAMNGAYLNPTVSEVIITQELDLYNLGISDLTGIQGFTNLAGLICDNNNLTSLPPLPNTLKTLSCSVNPLGVLPSNLPDLTALYCGGDGLSSLPPLPESLQDLVCDYNQLTELPILPSSLLSIACRGNQLTHLPLLPPTLQFIYCDNNSLINLPQLPSSLTTLYCLHNSLTTLPTLPSGLVELWVMYNPISCLPNLPMSLTLLLIPATVTCLPNTPLNCQVNQDQGASGSSTVTLPVCDGTNGCPPISGCVPVTITSQPVNQTASSGNTATFSIALSGDAPFSYQWWRNGVLIDGATNASYTTSPVAIGNNGFTYHCVVTNCSGSFSLTSVDAVLSVTSCIPPSNPPNPTSNSPQSGSVTITRNGSPSAGITWYWQGTSCGTNTTLGSGATFTTATSGTYFVRAYNASTGCWSSGCGSITVSIITDHIYVSPVGTEIPDWNRESDNFSAAVTAITTPANSAWHLRVKIFSGANVAATIDYPSGSTTWQQIQTFQNSAQDAQVTTAAISGRVVRIYAVHDASQEEDLAGSFNVIDKHLDNETLVYYDNGGTTENIKIPVRYINNTNYNNGLITLNRVYNTAKIGMGLTEPPTTLTVQFDVDVDGYLRVNSANSNIADDLMQPGEFTYTITGLGMIPESGTISVVKIGRLNNVHNNDAASVSSSQVVVIIGGIYNQMEQSFSALDNLTDDSNSGMSFSIATYLAANLSVDVWYIAQGNVNAVKRNGYDIAMALSRIQLTKSPTPTEIDLVCHSKGGLDVRAFIQNLSQGLDGNGINFSTSLVGGTLKKILFLDTPHRGSDFGSLAAFIPGLNSLTAPQGLYDVLALSNSIGILHQLNSSTVPASIKYANLTGYRNLMSANDGIVSVNSSENPINGCLQMYQNDIRPDYQGQFLWFNSLFDILHMQIHKNKFLSSQGKCTSMLTNLEKIKLFIEGGTQPTCVRNGWSFQLQPIGSILSNADVSFKRSIDTAFNLIGKTDENGNVIFELFDLPTFDDSIKIEASGYEPVVLGIDSSILMSGKIAIGLFKSAVATNKVQYPSLKLVSQNPITGNSSAIFQATGNNVIGYEINSPFNQDSIFVPLTLSNNQFTTSLDTGYNRMVVRFLGQQDTVSLVKELFYLTDTLLNSYTYNVTITSDINSIGAQVYVNNKFVKTITNNSEVVPVFGGRNTFKFVKFGYIDSLMNVDSAATINLSLQLVPHSYSSLTDSSIVDFPVQGKIQYRKSVTVMDSTRTSSITIRQYDDAFVGTGLLPKSRKFELTRLTPAWSTIRFAAVLDQIDNLSDDSIYLMKVWDDSLFYKIPIGTPQYAAAYDSGEQKLEYNNVNFNNGSVHKEALIVMRKQAPILNSSSVLSIAENDSLVLALTYFFADPDTMTDVSYQVGGSTHISAYILGDSLVIKPAFCWNGTEAVPLTATHDWLSRTQPIQIQTIPSPMPFVNDNGINILCSGDSIQLLSSAGSSYLWSTAATTSAINVGNEGIYSVTVTNEFGCIAEAKDTITSDGLTVDALVSSNSVCGENGLIVTNTSGGNEPYSYLWSTNETTNSISPMGGAFSVTVYDSNGCTVTTEDSVESYPAPELFVTSTPSFCDNDNGTADASYITYSALVSQIWNTGDSIPTLAGLSAGSYAITVTDANGCITTAGVTVGDSISSLDSLTVAITNAMCGADNGSLVLQAFGAGPFAYSWSNGNSTSSIANLTEGTYSVTVTDTNGCTSSDNYTVTQVPNTALVAINGPDTVWVDSINSFDVLLPLYDTIVWNADNGLLTGQGTNSVSVSWSTVGLHSLSVAVTDPNGCQGYDTLSVFVDASTGVIQSHRTSSEWTLFPNPASSSLTVQFYSTIVQPCKLAMYAVDGRLIYAFELNLQTGLTSKKIELNNLPAGSYFIKAVVSEHTECKALTITPE